MDTREQPGRGLRLLLSLQDVTPLALQAAVLQRLSPRQIALMAPYTRPHRLRVLIQTLSTELLAQTARHLDPQSILDTWLHLPDTLHLQIAKVLCRNQDFSTAARFAECLAPQQLRNLILGLNDPLPVLRIGARFGNVPLLVQSLLGMSSSYLRTLTEVSIPNGHLPLSVAVLSGLPARRQADICRQLSPAVRAALEPELRQRSDELCRLLAADQA
jgi:hypothetical protein